MSQYIMTDLDMMIATQIAYLDAGDSPNPNVTVGDLVDSIRKKYGVYNGNSWKWDTPANLKGKTRWRRITAN